MPEIRVGSTCGSAKRLAESVVEGPPDGADGLALMAGFSPVGLPPVWPGPVGQQSDGDLRVEVDPQRATAKAEMPDGMGRKMTA